MKATILGTDLLEYNNSVKILEINTNTTIWNDGADLLDYDALFTTITQNNITEFHYIYTEGDAYKPLNAPHRFEDILKEKCAVLGITYTPHVVAHNSVTVPYIEDSADKFILRQAFDTTALVDEMYCADKFEFFNLMSGSEYIPNTYFTSNTISTDSLSTLNFENGNEPNLVKKNRYALYDTLALPAIYSIQTSADFDTFKSAYDASENNLLQEFVYDTANIVDGKYSVIRSIDIIYGSNLDVISMGGYRQSAIIPLSFALNEFKLDSNELNQKTRYKYITKQLGNHSKVDYHTDDESMILDYTGSLVDVDTIKLGDYIKSINFTDVNGTGPSHDRNIEVYGWDSDLAQSNATLTEVSSSLVGIVSASVDTIFVKITLENGLTWSDAPSCTYYIVESGSTATRFEKVNHLYVGDKIVVTDSETNSLSTLEITGLEMEYASKTIYGLDFEPSDLFLVDIGDGLFSIMHNSCWCPWNYCGHWCNSVWCPSCDYPFGKA
jgi:hypothetical protein